MRWDRVIYEMMESYWPAPWTNSRRITGDLRMGVQKLDEATPAGVLVVYRGAQSSKLIAEASRPPHRRRRD